MIQVPLSQIPSEEAFAAEVEAYRLALEKHQMGKAGKPVPIAGHLVSMVVSRVPQDGPVASRGPDEFVVIPYEIVDDRPPPAPVVEETLAERKARLTFELQQAVMAAKSAILSPARAQLLSMDAIEAMAVPESARSPAQQVTIDAYAAYVSQCAAIDRKLLRAEIELEDVDDSDISSWRVPTF